MLTVLIVLALIKMYCDQIKEDKIARRIEEYEKHWHEPDDFMQ